MAYQLIPRGVFRWGREIRPAITIKVIRMAMEAVKTWLVETAEKIEPER